MSTKPQRRSKLRCSQWLGCELPGLPLSHHPVPCFRSQNSSFSHLKLWVPWPTSSCSNLAARVPPYAPMGSTLLDLTKSATVWHFVPGSVHLTVSSSPWMSQVTGFHVLHPLTIHLELRNTGQLQIVAGMNGATNEQPWKRRCLFRAPTLSHLDIPDNGTAGSYVISIFVSFYRKLHSVTMISVPIYIPPMVHPGLPSYTSSLTIRV